MLESELSVLNVLVHDASIIPYRKEFNRITGSVTASILLQQIIYRCGHQNTPFYGFLSYLLRFFIELRVGEFQPNEKPFQS